MATRGHSPVHGKHVLHVKGAPEVVLERCRYVDTPSGPDPIANHLAAIRAAALGARRTVLPEPLMRR